MAGRMNLVVFAAIVIAAAVVLPESTRAAVHIVGDTKMGWQVPSGSSDYPNWAAQNTFVVGDILVFNFITGQHSAAEVTKPRFDGCNIGNPISLQTNAPANFTLNASGEHYFICTFSDHCSRGQKLEVNVTTGSGSGSPPSSPPPPGSPPSSSPSPPGSPPRSPTPPSDTVAPPPPPNSAPRATIYTFSLLFISIVIAFLF